MAEALDTGSQIEALERELREGHQRLAVLRRAQGPEPVPDHVLTGSDGAVRLSEAFGDQRDLIVIHNMGRSCPYCTMWADGLQGLLPHLQDRAAFVVVSPDPVGVQTAFARSRGWTFPMLSAAGTSFTRDLGYAREEDGELWMLPGFSTFRKTDDGSIERVAHGPFGPGDPFNAAFHLFDHLHEGMGDWRACFEYGSDPKPAN